MNGTIIWYSAQRKYGFVRPLDGGHDIVFDLDPAARARLGEIRTGMAVHYLVRHDMTGPVAHHLMNGHMQEDLP